MSSTTWPGIDYLDDCPHCGADAKVLPVGKLSASGWFHGRIIVRCPKCGASVAGPKVNCRFEKLLEPLDNIFEGQKAIERWNQREG
ncbi:MAG: Lar family restriction alleviation protein [Clostridiales bacterium]|nr:Lar family restriction alleviation protein [Clostridiales bacterium]